jgi:hypothetical protein
MSSPQDFVKRPSKAEPMLQSPAEYYGGQQNTQAPGNQDGNNDAQNETGLNEAGLTSTDMGLMNSTMSSQRTKTSNVNNVRNKIRSASRAQSLRSGMNSQMEYPENSIGNGDGGNGANGDNNGENRGSFIQSIGRRVTEIASKHSMFNERTTKELEGKPEVKKFVHSAPVRRRIIKEVLVMTGATRGRHVCIFEKTEYSRSNI